MQRLCPPKHRPPMPWNDIGHWILMRPDDLIESEWTCHRIRRSRRRKYSPADGTRVGTRV